MRFRWIHDDILWIQFDGPIIKYLSQLVTIAPSFRYFICFSVARLKLMSGHSNRVYFVTLLHTEFYKHVV